ncbi:MAG: CHASE2 domain-containing protein [Roseobacter sp.]
MTRRPMWRLGALGGSLFGAAIWVLFLSWYQNSTPDNALDRLEYQLVDARYAITGPRAADENVVVVAIDDATLSSPDTATLSPRQRLTRIIGNIAQSNAQALAVDILLADAGVAADDAALADVLGMLPSVLAAAAVFDANTTAASTLIWPSQVFLTAAQAGLVNLSTDNNGTPRFIPLLLPVKDTLHPSLVLLSALSFTGAKGTVAEGQFTLGNRRIPLDASYNMPLRLVGPEGAVPTISASLLLEGPLLEALAGKMVVLGFTASAMGDRFSTPFDASTPGVEIIATAISQVIGGASLQRDDTIRNWDVAHAAMLAVLCIFAVTALPLGRGIPVVLGLLTLSLAAITVFFANGIWMSAGLPLLAVLPPVMVVGVIRYAQERKQATQSEQAAASLRRFQSPALARLIESDPNYLMAPQEQNLVIFFVDLTGFTGLSQRLGTEGTRDFLRSFHEMTNAAVSAEGGSVFNFMGDGALAVFGLDCTPPEAAGDDALTAAFTFARQLSNHRLDAMPNELLGCRIGLHFGPVTLSRLGAETHQQVSVTGDSVNLASRLMEVAKSEHAVIVASNDFAQTLTEDARQRVARRADVPIRGRSGTVPILLWDEQDVGANSV